MALGACAHGVGHAVALAAGHNLVGRMHGREESWGPSRLIPVHRCHLICDGMVMHRSLCRGHQGITQTCSTASPLQKDSMDLCLRTFEGSTGLQHRCGTGVGMQLKEHITDPVMDCGNLPLPASCFEYAWVK